MADAMDSGVWTPFDDYLAKQVKEARKSPQFSFEDFVEMIPKITAKKLTNDDTNKPEGYDYQPHPDDENRRPKGLLPNELPVRVGYVGCWLTWALLGDSTIRTRLEPPRDAPLAIVRDSKMIDELLKSHYDNERHGEKKFTLGRRIEDDNGSIIIEARLIRRENNIRLQLKEYWRSYDYSSLKTLIQIARVSRQAELEAKLRYGQCGPSI